ncbi:LTV1-like protein [Euroglyphus maynei]|uniref:Protein LTV1 homolog n=1 Tax=Euroglyphus maynei TaxID=6958 RepID=A0A1Y3BGM3_EURMA|nr:LTV1-like protein [Euroglyphus maynei]
MGRKKVKKFIDKNNSITFQLVGRSQNDPLFVDETAPQYVLVEKKSRQEVSIDSKEDESNGSDPQKTVKDGQKRREEQIKYGIYFDDDYNYLQHLTDVTEISLPNGIDYETIKTNQKKPSLMLPSSVFESTVVEKNDLNKKAALPVGPQLDWDPDIVEAMEDDFDFDDPNNQIDDDFVMQAMLPKNNQIIDINDTIDDHRIEPHSSINEAEEEDNLSVCGFDGSDDDDDDQFNIDAKMMAKKNIKRFFGLADDHDDDGQTIKTSASTHFTEYSMSSSVLPRNDKLQTLDEQFEQMFIREYADQMEMGALDAEEIKGDIDPNRSDLMAKLVEEYEEFKSGSKPEYERNEQAIDFVRRKYLKAKNNDNADEDSSESEKEEVEIVDPGRKGDKDRFDCESILSAYSSTNYHPKVLNESIDRYGNRIVKNSHIRVDHRTGMPITATGSNLRLNTLANLDGKSTRSNLSRLSELSIRPKYETTEERRQRKKELKELRAERRAEKKSNRLAFNEEKIRLHKADMNKSVQKKVTVN